MPPRTDFLTKQRQQIEARLRELQPAHEEYLTLLKARDALARRDAAPTAGADPAVRAGQAGPGPPARERQQDHHRRARATAAGAADPRGSGARR